MKIVFGRLRPYHNCIGQINDIVIGHLYTAAQFVVNVCQCSFFLVIIKDVPAHADASSCTWLRLSYQTISHPKLTIHSTQIEFAVMTIVGGKKTWGGEWHISYAKLIDKNYSGEFLWMTASLESVIQHSSKPSVKGFDRGF